MYTLRALGDSPAYPWLICMHGDADTPQALATSDDPVGPDNDLWLTSVIGGAPHAIAMWGNHGARIYSEGIRRDTLVITLRSKWSCFGKTKLGAPKHLYTFQSNTASGFFAMSYEDNQTVA